MIPDDESRLVSRAQGGDLEAFNALVVRYQDYLYTIAYRLMGDAAAASDMTQEAFIAAYQKLSSYSGGSLKAWLARIVTNRCYDELRRGKRRHTTALDDLSERSGARLNLVDSAPSPESVAQQNELQRALQHCIAGLPPDQRLVLVMSDVQGMTYQEIAETAALNLGTVKSRLSRARMAMRACLQSIQELLPAEYRLVNNK